jgi:hypothetical protein
MLRRYELHAKVRPSVKRRADTRPKRRVKDSIEREQTYPGNITAGFLTIVETNPRPLEFEPRWQRRLKDRPGNSTPEIRPDAGTEARPRPKFR